MKGYSRNRLRGERMCICDTCGVRYLRSQLVRGPDGFLRCSGPGTLNDARGRTALELDELQAQAAEEMGHVVDYVDDGGRIDNTADDVGAGGDEIGV